MFDFIFSSMTAFQSIMMMCGALICLAIGATLSGDFLNWRLNAKRIKGKIISYEERKGGKQTFYYPIAEYCAKNGEIKRVTSEVGSSYLNSKKVGRSVIILHFPNTDKKPRILGSGLLFVVIGLIFIVTGLFLFYQAALLFEMNWYSAAVIFGVCAFIWSKFQRIDQPFKKFKKMKRQSFKNNVNNAVNVSDNKSQSRKELTIKEIKMIQSKADVQQGRWAWLVLLIGLLFLGIGGYVGHSVWFLETYGIAVKGRVTDMKTNTDSDNSTTYSPIITYVTNKDESITFTSNYGSNPPRYKAGDEVSVLYDTENPSDNVMIDLRFMELAIAEHSICFRSVLVFNNFSQNDNSRATRKVMR